MSGERTPPAGNAPAAPADKAGKGALLRREGLYTSLISEWRGQRDRGALEALGRRPGRPQADPRDAEIARLKREMNLPRLGDIDVRRGKEDR